jgi:hypothetical protein
MFMFEKPLSFNELVDRVREVMNVGCDLRLHGRYDMRGRHTNLCDATCRV